VVFLRDGWVCNKRVVQWGLWGLLHFYIIAKLHFGGVVKYQGGVLCVVEN